MRTNLRVFAAALALGITSLVFACSSSDDTSTPTPDPDAGNSSSGSSGTSSGSSGTSGSSGSSGTSGGPTDAATDAADAADANVAFAITSTAFKEGGAIPVAQAQNCKNGNNMQINGMNKSPALAWTHGPATTRSYAVEVHDATNNLVHAVIYDIPATVFMLPENEETKYDPAIPAGAHQAKNISGQPGYAGPCPPNQHTYEFILYAVDVATLPNTNANTTKDNVVAALKTHMVATTKLTGTFTP